MSGMEEENKTREALNLSNTYTPLFISQILKQVYATDVESKYHSFQMRISNGESNQPQSCEIKLNRCCIMGYVTSVDPWLEKKINITIDDGTASIKCLKWIHSDNNSCYDHDMEMLSIGQLVEVKGRLHMYKEFKELIIENLSIMVSQLQECYFWMHCIQIQNYIKEKCMKRVTENDSGAFGSSSLQHIDENEE